MLICLARHERAQRVEWLLPITSQPRSRLSFDFVLQSRAVALRLLTKSHYRVNPASCKGSRVKCTKLLFIEVVRKKLLKRTQGMP